VEWLKVKTLSSNPITAKKKRKERNVFKPGAVAQDNNLSYLGGRDQEDHCLRPSWAKSS
jgi:hypothetical protein